MKQAISTTDVDAAAKASVEWRSYIEPLLPIAERVVGTMPEPQNPLLRQELYRQMFSLIAQAYWHLLYQDPDNPDFVPFWYNYGAPNPDDLYTSTPIRGDGVYRISGTRGSAHIVTFSVGSGMFYTRGIGTVQGRCWEITILIPSISTRMAPLKWY